jgi:hypothetical protein
MPLPPTLLSTLHAAPDSHLTPQAALQLCTFTPSPPTHTTHLISPPPSLHPPPPPHPTPAGDLSSWWTSLDQQPSQGGDSNQVKVRSASAATADMVAHFGLAEDESFVEEFKCKLSQVGGAAAGAGAKAAAGAVAVEAGAAAAAAAA